MIKRKWSLSCSICPIDGLLHSTALFPFWLRAQGSIFDTYLFCSFWWATTAARESRTYTYTERSGHFRRFLLPAFFVIVSGGFLLAHAVSMSRADSSATAGCTYMFRIPIHARVRRYRLLVCLCVSLAFRWMVCRCACNVESFFYLRRYSSGMVVRGGERRRCLLNDPATRCMS